MDRLVEHLCQAEPPARVRKTARLSVLRLRRLREEQCGQQTSGRRSPPSPNHSAARFLKPRHCPWRKNSPLPRIQPRYIDWYQSLS